MDYYKSGVIKQEGISVSREYFSSNKEVISYYENGNKKSIIQYFRGIPHGRIIEWYENGSKKMEGNNKLYNRFEVIEHKPVNYEKPIKYKSFINNFWDEKGVQQVIKGNGFYENNNEKGFEKGELKNGLKEGVWEGSSKKNNCSFTEIYKNGELISGVSKDKDGNTYNYSKIEKTSAKFNEKQVFDINNLVKKKTNNSNSNFKEYRGSLSISFMVERDGEITEIKIFTKLKNEINQELVSIISQYKGLSPDEHRGVKVRCLNFATLYF